jgi:hypothetical protein
MAYVQTANPSVIKKAHAGERIAVLFFLVVFDTVAAPRRQGWGELREKSLFMTSWKPQWFSIQFVHIFASLRR